MLPNNVWIYRCCRNVMQSGKKDNKPWILDFPRCLYYPYDLFVEWPSYSDMASQVKMRFASKEAAVSFAERQGWQWREQIYHKPKHIIKRYADTLL